MQTSMSWYLCQTLPQLLGISALAAALTLLRRGTASTALQLTQPLERCCFQGLFSNICSASPGQLQGDAGCYRGVRVHLKTAAPTPAALAMTQRRYVAKPLSAWHFPSGAPKTLC